MIGKRQLALARKAMEALSHSAALRYRVLEVAGAPSVEALSRKGFELFMDQCTVLTFRDPRRPILSAATCESLEGLFKRTGMRPVHRATMLREFGHCAEPSEMTGEGLLRVLVQLEKDGADVKEFIEARRSITFKQSGLLQFARKSADISQESYSDIIQIYGGVNSASDLDQRGFDLVMAWFRVMGFDDARPAAPAPAPDFGTRPGFASAAQLGLIRELWAEWSGAADEAGLATWLERSYRVSALRFLKAGTASGAITALKTMKRRKAAASELTTSGPRAAEGAGGRPHGRPPGG